MLMYFDEVSLDDGFEVLAVPNKESRLVRGRRVSRCSGYELFSSLREAGQPLKCWQCGVEASCFVVNKGHRDLVKSPVLDLYAIKNGVHMLMTRDHIIPRSLGGGDMVANLRVGCSECNSARGNALNDEDREFMLSHSELIVREPNPVVPQCSPLSPEERKERDRLKRRRRQKARRERAKAKRRLAHEAERAA